MPPLLLDSNGTVRTRQRLSGPHAHIALQAGHVTRGTPSTTLEHAPLQPISAVIVNYNAGALIETCVATALTQVAEVVVVDNASRDTSMRALRTRWGADARVILVENDANLGFSAGCNRGWAVASQPYVLFLNPDGRLEPGAAQALLAALQSEAGAGMAGGDLRNPDGSPQRGSRRELPTLWSAFVSSFGLTRLARRWPRWFADFNRETAPLPSHTCEVQAISGACMLLRRDTMAALGGWDEGYFLHCEDLDLCMRVRQAGLRVLFVPQARIVHQQGHSSGSRPYFVEWHKHKGMLRFYRKFYGNQIAGLLFVTVGILLRYGLTCLRLTFKRARGHAHD